MKASPAQLKYLRNAAAVCDAGTGRGSCFRIHGPGPVGTGKACERRKWISKSFGFVLYITDLGRQVLAEGEADHE